MKVTTNGEITELFDTQIKGNDFKVREFVLKVDEKNEVKLQLTGDKCDFLDNYQVGNEVEVSFWVNGKRWEKNDGTTAFFTQLNCSFIKKTSEVTATVEEENPF